MVLLRDLLEGIPGSVLDKDDAWNIKSHKSKEQCHTLIHTSIPCEKKIVLELRILNQNGGSEQLLLASRDVIAENTGLGESYGIASDKNETNSAHKSDCTSHLGLGLYHRERTKETDERICLGDEDEGDNEAGNDDVSAGEGGNEVGRGENVNENSNKVNDNNSNDEIEEENKRGQQHRSECCTNDHACKPISLGDNPHLLTISEGAAGQHESKKRQRNTSSAPGNKRRKNDYQGSKALKDADDRPGVTNTISKRQFREDCQDILDTIFKTIWDPKLQFISSTDILPSYRVIDRADAASNLEPVIDVIEDNEINHVLAAMLRVVNQVFLMRTIEVACAETAGSAHHAQGIVLQRIASHLQHRQVKRGKSPLSRMAAMAAARQLKFSAYRTGRLCQQWGTVCVLLACIGIAFTTKTRYTSKEILEKIAHKMHGILPIVRFVADCEHPQWRDVFAICPSLREIDPSSLNPPLAGVNLREWALAKNLTPTKLPHYIYINESRIGEWNRDPRRLQGGPEIACVQCGEPQLDTKAKYESPPRKSCRCMGSFSLSENTDRFLIFETEDRGFGVKALNTYKGNIVIGEFVGRVVKEIPKDRDILAGGATSFVQDPYYLDTTSEGNWTRFVNHSCHGYNCVVNRFVWRGIERMVLQVRRDYTVKVLEELTINYGKEYLSAQGAGWCKCESCKVK